MYVKGTTQHTTGGFIEVASKRAGTKPNDLRDAIMTMTIRKCMTLNYTKKKQLVGRLCALFLRHYLPPQSAPCSITQPIHRLKMPFFG
jgi:hypothetical protein